MENLHFNALTLAGYGVSGALMILIPVLLLIVWKKRTQTSVIPVFAGAGVFLVFVMVLETIPAYLLMMTDTALAHAINASVWLKCLVGGLLAGVFEETGRFIAFRFVLKKHTGKETAIMYGIGHGGFESIVLGVTMLSYILLGVLVNSGNTEMIVQGVEGEQLQTVMKQLQAYASQTFGTSILAVAERISALLLHLGLSVLVFRAVHNRKCLWLYPLSILLHTLFDFSTVLYAGGMMPLVAFEIVMFAMAAAVFLMAWRFVYRTMQTGGNV